MMKKLLILMLVFGMTSLASAALQISVNGDQDPTSSEFWLLPSETLTLDIWTDSNISPGTGEGYWALAATFVDATISGGVVAPPYDTEPGITIYDDAVGVGGVPLPAGENGVWGTIILTGVISLIPAGDTIYDEIDFHCEWQPNDVVITLYGTDFSTVWAVDSVIIHQGAVPEPMTLALLGLGGLFLRRRK